MKRPGRPFGVAVAIAAGTFLFAVLPLLQVGMVLSVRQHFLYGSAPTDAIASGADIVGGVSGGQLLLQAALAMGFVVIAVATWRGRPPVIRFVYMGVVIMLTLVKLAVMIAQTLNAPDVQEGLSSGDGVFQSIAVGQWVLEFLVMVYVVWYLNRGPARAFFRGYFLSRPTEAATHEESAQARL